MANPKIGCTSDAPDCADCELGGTAIYRGIVQTKPQLVMSCRSEVVRYAPNRVVMRQDQTPTAIYTVHDGWLYRYRKLSNGRQQIISFIIPGDTITFSSIFMPGKPLCYGIKSASHVQLCAFDRDNFRKIIGQDAAFMGPYQLALADYLDSLHRRLADIGQRSAKGRLTQLLVELFQRHEKRHLVMENSFEFPVSQELLAKALGLTKAYVNRILTALKSGGLIRLEDRRLKIIDLTKLQNIADVE